MAKTTKVAKSSWQLGWVDGIERKVGRSLTTEGIDTEAYARGVKRAGEFRRRIAIRPQVERADEGGEFISDRPPLARVGSARR